MSSFQSPGNAPAQRIPAWKRLGLKLKAASEEQSQNATLHPSTAAPLVPNRRRENPTGPVDTNAKRKSSGVPALDRSAKRAKTDVPQNQTTPNRTPKKAKSVSFAVDSTQGAGSQAATNGTQPSTKRKQPPTKKSVPAPAKPLKKQAPVNLEPALAYLRQWHTSRDTWKFNKNHQTRLLEQVFADETTIPAADIHIFYEYIRPLKGAVRSRLKELASGTKAQDMEQGPEGFPASGKEMAERKQKEYQEVIAAFLGQPRTPGKRRFEEIDYVLRTADMEMQRRVVKRMRCEMVLDELSDSETETASTTTATTTTSTENESSTAGDLENGANGVATDAGEETLRLRLNDGPQQRLKRKRKVRTAIVDDESSSESDSSSSSGSESDEDVGSSSDSSSSDESDDDVVQAQLRAIDAESSSSSSSSSEASDSDSDEDDD
ncbi:Proteasome subunit YC7alpha/Y8 (protease yscE subunit 7) [Hypoxylon texense]